MLVGIILFVIKVCIDAVLSTFAAAINGILMFQSNHRARPSICDDNFAFQVYVCGRK
jgi:hypothetical protein